GARRIVYPWVGCGKCAACLSDEDNMCLTPKSLGVFQNGGYATHVVAPHPRHLVDPGTLGSALAGTYACCGITGDSAVGEVMPMPGDEPLVLVGAGGLGLSALAVLKALGHRNTIVVDISAEKRAAAVQAGAAKVVDGAGEGVAKRIIEAAGGQAGAIIDLVN